MKLGSRHKPDPAFNMSSMTDLIFLLLIFFVLTSSITPVGRKVDLPSDGASKSETKPVVVEVLGKDNYKISGTSVPFNQLKKISAQEIKKEGVSTTDDGLAVLVIKGGSEVEYDQIMKVVQECSSVPNIEITIGEIAQ
jgi:biopolymer transport protein ExbD